MKYGLRIYWSGCEPCAAQIVHLERERGEWMFDDVMRLLPAKQVEQLAKDSEKMEQVIEGNDTYGCYQIYIPLE